MNPVNERSETDSNLDATGDEDAFDDQPLIDLVGGAPERLTAIYRALSQTCADVLQRFDHATAENDLDALGKLAHRLKSAARQVRATRLGELCRRLEQHANEANGQGIDAEACEMLARIRIRTEHLHRWACARESSVQVGERS